VSKTIEISVPDIGDFSDVPVIEILVAEGDRISAEDSLVTLESDKATMEVPSPSDGILREIRVKLDDTVSEGDVVAVLELSDVTGSDAPSDAEAEAAAPAEEPTPPPPPAPKQPASETKLPRKTTAQPVASSKGRVPHASPALRRFARELGVDLTAVNGSGNKGRILREDVSRYVKSVMAGDEKTPQPGMGFDFPQLPEFDFSRFGEVETQALGRIRKLSAGHLHRNWVSIPHVTQNDEADISDMEAFRKANAEEAMAKGFKLTPLVFMMKAAVAALKKFPDFNASLDSSGENLILKKYFNIGIAVDTPEGLVVPVIRGCDRKGIMELAEELGQVSARAREKKLKPQDIQGGCFSISSLGGIGGTSFTPIINAPEVAILGVSRSRMAPVWDGNEFQPRLMLPLSLSYDHRVIDGAAAARFTRYLASCLEDLRRLTL
jgi:pyruvate dehydrogenase E2 component (dihydrolipoamide acetyltransferase)